MGGLGTAHRTSLHLFLSFHRLSDTLDDILHVVVSHTRPTRQTHTALEDGLAYVSKTKKKLLLFILILLSVFFQTVISFFILNSSIAPTQLLPNSYPTPTF